MTRWRAKTRSIGIYTWRKTTKRRTILLKTRIFPTRCINRHRRRKNRDERPNDRKEQNQRRKGLPLPPPIRPWALQIIRFIRYHPRNIIHHRDQVMVLHRIHNHLFLRLRPWDHQIIIHQPLMVVIIKDIHKTFRIWNLRHRLKIHWIFLILIQDYLRFNKIHLILIISGIPNNFRLNNENIMNFYR